MLAILKPGLSCTIAVTNSVILATEYDHEEMDGMSMLSLWSFSYAQLMNNHRTNNTIQKRLMHNRQTTDIHSRSGVYKLTCPDCKKAYVEQTGRSFAIRFQEHKMAFKTGNKPSNFAKHLMEHTHSLGPIHNTLQVLQLHNKGAHLNMIERFHIYSEYSNNNHLKDESTIFPNKIFDILLKPHQP